MSTYRDRWPMRALAATLCVLTHGVLAQAPPGGVGDEGPAQSQPPLSASPPETAAPSSVPSTAPTSAPTAATSADLEAWHTVTGPEKSFTADLPAPPKYTTTEMKTLTGSLYTVHQYLLEQGEVAYI